MVRDRRQAVQGVALSERDAAAGAAAPADPTAAGPPAATRSLGPAEAAQLIDWAAAEGWNPGLDDAAQFHAADPGGFHGAFSGDALAAGVSLVRYGDRFAFLGLYLCRPDLRGRGFGMAAWRAAMRAAGERCVGLDGVPARQGDYARSGFRLAWNNLRLTGTGGGGRPPGLVALDALPPATLPALDQFEAVRDGFLGRWASQARAVGLAALRDGAPVGWGLLRRCRSGRKIGPLFAADAAAGEALLDGLLSAAPGEAVSIDLPAPNAAALRAAERRGMTVGFETARMYRGVPPRRPDLDRVWGLCSFELG